MEEIRKKLTLLNLDTKRYDVPYEIVLQILRYLPLEFTGDTVLLLQLFPRVEIKQLIKDRCNPIYLFSQIVQEPMELMRIMLCTHVSLVGSRAIDYFLPGSCVPESDWDFVCPNNYYHAVYFLGYLDKMGFGEVTFSDTYSGRPDLFSIKGTLKSMGKTHTINVVKSDYVHGLFQVLDFDLSICTCCVTGAGAYSLYSATTQKSKLMVSSNYEHICTTGSCRDGYPDSEDEPDNAQEDRLEKYIARGMVGIIEQGYSNLYSNVPCMSRSRNRIRSSGDNDSHTVSFVGILPYHKRERDDVIAILESLEDVIWWHEPRGTKYEVRLPSKVLDERRLLRGFGVDHVSADVVQYIAQKDGFYVVIDPHRDPDGEAGGNIDIPFGFYKDSPESQVQLRIVLDKSGVHDVPDYVHQLYEYPSDASIEKFKRSMHFMPICTEEELTGFMQQPSSF